VIVTYPAKPYTSQAGAACAGAGPVSSPSAPIAVAEAANSIFRPIVIGMLVPVRVDPTRGRRY